MSGSMKKTSPEADAAD